MYTYIVCISVWLRWAEILLSWFRWWKTITLSCLVSSCNYCLPLSFQTSVLPLGPCLQLHPVQPSCDVRALRYYSQGCQKHMSRFSLWITSFKYHCSRNILKMFSLLASQLNEEQFVLARAEKSEGNSFFPIPSKIIASLFTWLKRRCFLILPMCTLGTQRDCESQTQLGYYCASSCEQWLQLKGVTRLLAYPLSSWLWRLYYIKL